MGDEQPKTITLVVDVTEEDYSAVQFHLCHGDVPDWYGPTNESEMRLIMGGAVQQTLLKLRSKVRWKELFSVPGYRFKMRGLSDVREPIAGHWECDRSPSQTCWYGSKTDPCWDRCLFCGEPDERK